jgi:hypothetical protein
MKKFKTDGLLKSLKEMHITDFETKIKKTENQLSFLETSQDYLPKLSPLLDLPLVFLETSSADKLISLTHQFEKLNTFNCWASSRWEYAYYYTCFNYVVQINKIGLIFQRQVVQYAN